MAKENVAAARTIGQTFTSQESLAALERARFSDKDLSVQSQAQLALMRRSGEGLFSQTEWRTYLAQEGAAIPGATARMAFCSFSKARTSICRTRSRLMP